MKKANPNSLHLSITPCQKPHTRKIEFDDCRIVNEMQRRIAALVGWTKRPFPSRAACGEIGSASLHPQLTGLEVTRQMR
ncbi:hypothetical protein TBK1r_79320 [Stieleria magnilauensis]|uniref:Uncharacterized protein n=1 Tax=Stieleria magnilauensis TaxID=2527963 RepID=A0ABX5Y3N0_9BACT|nr:hypothetical protein TBK1r_79320 [Planctomycetes bacterium TBK1r]